MLLRKICVFPLMLALAFLAYTAPKAQADSGFHIWKVTEIDGTVSFQELHVEDAKDLKDRMRDEYRDANKEWEQQKKRWTEAVGAAGFPMPKPRPPKVQRMRVVSTTNKQRERDLANYNNKYEKWDVCIITDHHGEAAAEVIKCDKVYSRRKKLYGEYYDAVMEMMEARKANPDLIVDKEDRPKTPSVKTVKSGMRDLEDADKWADALNKKIAQMAAKKAKKAQGESVIESAP